MSFMMDKVARITGSGFGVVFCWILGKSLFGVGLGLLLAIYIPSDNWLRVGWLCVILSLLVSVPAMKAAWLKPDRPC